MGYVPSPVARKFSAGFITCPLRIGDSSVGILQKDAMHHVKKFPVDIFSIIVYSKQLVIADKRNSLLSNTFIRTNSQSKDALKSLKPVDLTSGFACQKGRKIL